MSEKEKTVDTAKEEEKTVSKMYIGPTFPGVEKASVYTNGLPDPLKEKVENYPVFGELIVDIGDLPATRKELANPESAVSRCYKIAESVLKKGE